MTKHIRYRDFSVGRSSVLSEEIHSTIQNVLNSEGRSAAMRHSAVTSNIRSLIKRGEDTGLEDDKPKKGSSRVVYFPKEHHKTTIDGHEVHVPSALKIAYAGQLDKYKKGDESLLGEHQNAEENSYHARSFGIIHPVGGDNHSHSFETNPHGVFVSVLDHHEDHHWSLHGRVDKIGTGDFNALTKTEDFPKGISHKDFYDAVNLHHHDAHGSGGMFDSAREDHLRKIQSHPFVENVTDAMFSTGMHPGDLNKRNMGVWTHPVTGNKHLVISDYGYTGEVAKEYNKRRMCASQANRGY